MLKEKNSLFRKFQVIFDLGVTVVSFLVTFFYITDAHTGTPLRETFSRHLMLLYAALPLWFFLLRHNNAYLSIRTLSLGLVIRPYVKTVVYGGILIIAAFYILDISSIDKYFILYFLGVNLFFMLILRIAEMAALRLIRGKGYNFRTIIIVGTGKRADEFAKMIGHHKHWGLKVVGFVDGAIINEERTNNGKKVLGTIEELHSILTSMVVDEVVFVLPRRWIDRVEKGVQVCEEIGIKAMVAVDYYPGVSTRMFVEEMMSWPLVTINPTHHIDRSVNAKRAVDIVLSALILAIISPFFLIVSAAIKLTSPGPLFFKQERCCLNGRRFTMYKFRTMHKNAESMKSSLVALNEMSGPVFKIKQDPRITHIGRFLRKYSLDELPQFYNVLKGDMSIVGPRPPLPEEVEKYKFWQRRRLSVKPGIICLWQVNGRNNIDFDEWMKLDMEYIDTWSLKLDTKIMLKSISVILKGSGV